MLLIHSSSCSTVRALTVGKAPTMPARHASMTSSGPDTRNIGAATTGTRSGQGESADSVVERRRRESGTCVQRGCHLLNCTDSTAQVRGPSMQSTSTSPSLLDFDGLRPPSPFMNEAHAQWRALVRDFVTREIEPNLDAWEASGTFPDALYESAARQGLLGIGFPERVGGHTENADPYYRVIFAEEMHRLGSGVVFADLATHWIGLPPVVQFGSEATAGDGRAPGARWKTADRVCGHGTLGRLRCRRLADTRRPPRRPLARQRLEDTDLGCPACGLHSRRRPHRQRRRRRHLTAAHRCR